MQYTVPTAGLVENALSEKVSNEVFASMLRDSEESGLQMGFAAVMTGTMDALARFATVHNVAGLSPEDLSGVMALQLEMLLRSNSRGPAGSA